MFSKKCKHIPSFFTTRLQKGSEYFKTADLNVDIQKEATTYYFKKLQIWNYIRLPWKVSWYQNINANPKNRLTECGFTFMPAEADQGGVCFAAAGENLAGLVNYLLHFSRKYTTSVTPSGFYKIRNNYFAFTLYISMHCATHAAVYITHSVHK